MSQRQVGAAATRSDDVVTRANAQALIANPTTAVKIDGPAAADSPALWVPAKSGGSNVSSVVVGDDIKVGTQGGRARVQIGSSTGISELLVGQSSNRALLFNWTWNSNADAGVANLETYGGATLLNVQNNSGPLRLSGSGGQLGFYGATPSGKPTVTGSRTDGTALASLLTALATLGLITNSTTA